MFWMLTRGLPTNNRIKDRSSNDSNKLEVVYIDARKGPTTCRATLVDGEVPCLLVVIELALAFHY
jgi:hypothetical protein